MPPTDPEHRTCLVTGRWAIVAPERGERPVMPADFCPFCPGSEWDTPGEVYAVRDPESPADGPGWSLRVVPNKFPAVRPDASDGFGFHEVLIDTPRHVTDPAELSVAETAAGLVAMRERLRWHAAHPFVWAVAAFRNVGAEAGASLGHTHAQIVATHWPDGAVTPDDLVASGRRPDDPCPTCQVVEYELADRGRVVAETPGFVALAAWAGRFDHEVWLLPKAHRPRFEGLTDADAGEFAGLLRRVRRAVGAALGRPAYNEVVYTAPPKETGGEGWRHWRLELTPRTARLAGFELGTGCHILTVAPERSAGLLRSHLPPEELP